MKICLEPQGSEGWHLARVGALTGSMYRTIRDTLKRGPNAGGYKAKALDYAFQVAMERVTQQSHDTTFQTAAMSYGKRLEPEAREAHAMLWDIDVEEVGYISTDDGRFGCSADGLIGLDGGSEYKCLVANDRLRRVLHEEDISEFMDQCQGGMMVSEREWWSLCFYLPTMANQPVVRGDTYERRGPIALFPIPRDDKYIADLQEDLEKFDEVVEQYAQKLRGTGPTLEGQLKESLEPSAAGIFG